MGIFDIFKKKTSPLAAAQERRNRMWELWAIGDVPSPVENLMTYHSEVNNGGHSQYFFNISNNGTLATEVEMTLSLLPEPLRENLRRAHAAFLTQDDIADDANDELFDECDDVFYKHEQYIIDIIQEAANNGFGHPNHA